MTEIIQGKNNAPILFFNDMDYFSHPVYEQQHAKLQGASENVINCSMKVGMSTEEGIS